MCGCEPGFTCSRCRAADPRSLDVPDDEMYAPNGIEWEWLAVPNLADYEPED